MPPMSLFLNLAPWRTIMFISIFSTELFRSYQTFNQTIPVVSIFSTILCWSSKSFPPNYSSHINILNQTILVISIFSIRLFRSSQSFNQTGQVISVFKLNYSCSLSLWRVVQGIKLTYLASRIHGLFIT